MRKLLLTGFLAIAVIAGAIAQKAGYDPVNAPFGHGEDSVNCRVNLSLMQTAAKAEAYESALIPWSSVYENCPAASKNTFIYGPRIFKALYEKETDAAKKKEYLDKTLEIYDKRITYFGKDDPKETIIAYKTYDYMELMGDQADQKQIYEWLNESVNGLKDKMYPLDAYSYYMLSSLSLYLNDNSLKDQYISDYFNVMDYIEKVEPNKTNKEFLSEVVNALGSIGCNDSDLYFTVSEYLHKLEPSANAALGLANKSLRDKDYETAVKYYSEAANLETDKVRASEYMLQLASIFSNQRNFARARQAAYDALEYNPNNGDAYILVAQLYASSANNIFPETEKAGLVYCAAVDKLQKARSVDPSVASKANSLISSYSARFLDTETAFMMGYKTGETVFIPGWIGENTTVRLR